MQDATFLLTKNVQANIAACGTASSVAHEIGDNLSVPFTGVVAPTAAAAVRATKRENWRYWHNCNYKNRFL